MAIISQAMKRKPRWATLLRQKRRKLKLTQGEMALMLGVTTGTISNWENGHREAPYYVTWWLLTEELKKR